eukprot:TRINITY_DN5062_c0_g2_i1.p1 TRINITY_DN5062_c0_g2~~TRINITY_DN5062_c0_g2_i1.p1  ORF type:complete len:934 (+),score=170.71 TRINITY_DN5062_c0_g2_i1:56-2803(+)
MCGEEGLTTEKGAEEPLRMQDCAALPGPVLLTDPTSVPARLVAAIAKAKVQELQSRGFKAMQLSAEKCAVERHGVAGAIFHTVKFLTSYDFTKVSRLIIDGEQAHEVVDPADSSKLFYRAVPVTIQPKASGSMKLVFVYVYCDRSPLMHWALANSKGEQVTLISSLGTVDNKDGRGAVQAISLSIFPGGPDIVYARWLAAQDAIGARTANSQQVRDEKCEHSEQSITPIIESESGTYIDGATPAERLERLKATWARMSVSERLCLMSCGREAQAFALKCYEAVVELTAAARNMARLGLYAGFEGCELVAALEFIPEDESGGRRERPRGVLFGRSLADHADVWGALERALPRWGLAGRTPLPPGRWVSLLEPTPSSWAQLEAALAALLEQKLLLMPRPTLPAAVPATNEVSRADAPTARASTAAARRRRKRAVAASAAVATAGSPGQVDTTTDADDAAAAAVASEPSNAAAAAGTPHAASAAAAVGGADVDPGAARVAPEELSGESESESLRGSSSQSDSERAELATRRDSAEDGEDGFEAPWSGTTVVQDSLASDPGSGWQRVGPRRRPRGRGACIATAVLAAAPVDTEGGSDASDRGSHELDESDEHRVSQEDEANWHSSLSSTNTPVSCDDSSSRCMVGFVEDLQGLCRLAKGWQTSVRSAKATHDKNSSDLWESRRKENASWRIWHMKKQRFRKGSCAALFDARATDEDHAYLQCLGSCTLGKLCTCIPDPMRSSPSGGTSHDGNRSPSEGGASEKSPSNGSSTHSEEQDIMDVFGLPPGLDTPAGEPITPWCKLFRSVPDHNVGVHAHKAARRRRENAVWRRWWAVHRGEEDWLQGCQDLALFPPTPTSTYPGTPRAASETGRTEFPSPIAQIAPPIVYIPVPAELASEVQRYAQQLILARSQSLGRLHVG